MDGFITSLSFFGIENYGKLSKNILFHELSVKFKKYIIIERKKNAFL